ncbi:MAG: serine/threonine protein phosphatase [Caulobacterales bacterium]|jgi:serine/threonine protein phosphatase 1|nr:serine/threonine protein phosphatase [Caulobacterales bacterium]
MSEHVYYAIGDVHGEADKLERLSDDIRNDAARAGASHKIIYLGDMIDRGPDSRAVVLRAMQEAQAGEAIALKGNHEELMLHAYDRDETMGLYHWATNGGDDTIRSYQQAHGVKDHWREVIDSDHIKWLRTLPTIWRDEARGLVFVHAGIDPIRFPECSDGIRMWTRSRKFFDPGRWPDRPELEGIVVVHGHTPTQDKTPHVNRRRINVDTGACFGGPLTCVVLAPGEGPRFLHA